MSMQKAASIFLSVLTLTNSVWADATLLEEVVVVAQKREQNIQEVGIAVTAMSGSQMDALGFDNAQEVTAMAPGVQTVQPNGEANYSVGIRGVTNSDFTTNVESPVALYVDDVYVSQMSGAGFALFDMERVEILRGPQGTLFGRNATGGLVHFITRKPTDEFEGYSKFTYSDNNTLRFQAAVSGGLSETLSSRFSLAVNRGDGYVENRLTGDALNNTNDQTARLQFLYRPNDDLEALLNLRASKQDIDTGFFENVSSVEPGQLTPTQVNPVLGYVDNDGDVFAGDYDDPGFNDLQTSGASLTLNYSLSNSVELVSITDTSSVERTYIEDSDASPVSFFNFFLTTDAKQISQELRLDGTNDDWHWTVGGYYLDLDINDSNGAITEPFIGGGGTTAAGSEGGLNNPYRSQLESHSLFGQVEYLLSDTLTAIAGLRYIRDKKSFEYGIDAVEFLDPRSRSGFNSANNMALQATLGSYVGARTDSEIAARMQLDWAVNDDSLLYLSWNRGVKGGGYNAPVFPLSEPNGYDDATLSFEPEQLDAFELGYKMSFGEVGRLNVATYYYDYSDYQVFNIIGLDTFTINSPSATATGFEVEFLISPVDNLEVMLGAAYNDAETELLDGRKSRPVQSPEFTFNGLLRYTFFVPGGDLAAQGSFVYQDDVIFALTEASNVRQEAYGVGNLSLTYTTNDETWQLSAFVENISDEEYMVQAFDLSGVDVFGMTEQYYGKPRWWGVSVNYSW